MVHDLRVARAQLYGLYPAGLRHGYRQHEIAEHIDAFGGHRKRCVHGDHQVGLAELPALGEVRRRGPIGGVAFYGTLLDP